MDYLEYKGYKGSVEYSRQDNCLYGKVLGLSSDMIMYEGETLADLEADFRNGIDSYIEGCLLDGRQPRKPFSGQLTLRLSPEEHSALAIMAQQTGQSMSAIIKRAIQRECAMA